MFACLVHCCCILRALNNSWHLTDTQYLLNECRKKITWRLFPPEGPLNMAGSWTFLEYASVNKLYNNQIEW